MLKTDPIMSRVSRSTDPNVLYNEVLEIFKYQPVKHHTITVAERIKQKYMDRLGGKFKKREENQNGKETIDDVDNKKDQEQQIDRPLPSTDIPSTELESNGKKLKRKKKRKSRQEESKEFTETEPTQESPKYQAGEHQQESQKDLLDSESQKDRKSDPHEIPPVKVVSLSKIKQKIPMMFASSDPNQDIFEWKDANQNEPEWTPITKDHLLKLPTIACPDEKTWNYFQQSTFKFEPYILVPIQKTHDESKQYFVAKMKN